MNARIIVAMICMPLLVAGTTDAQTRDGSLIKVDCRALVSRADLSYDKPVIRSEEGLPIGNGPHGQSHLDNPNGAAFSNQPCGLVLHGQQHVEFPERPYGLFQRLRIR